jgi:hypothetical protein
VASTCGVPVGGTMSDAAAAVAAAAVAAAVVAAAAAAAAVAAVVAAATGTCICAAASATGVGGRVAFASGRMGCACKATVMLEAGIRGCLDGDVGGACCAAELTTALVVPAVIGRGCGARAGTCAGTGTTRWAVCGEADSNDTVPLCTRAAGAGRAGALEFAWSESGEGSAAASPATSLRRRRPLGPRGSTLIARSRAWNWPSISSSLVREVAAAWAAPPGGEACQA